MEVEKARTTGRVAMEAPAVRRTAGLKVAEDRSMASAVSCCGRDSDMWCEGRKKGRSLYPPMAADLLLEERCGSALANAPSCPDRDRR